MVLDTPSTVEWDRYAGLCLARWFGVAVVVSLVFGILGALIPGPAWWVLFLGSLTTAASLVYVVFWTVAEMVEDGLADDKATGEPSPTADDG